MFVENDDMADVKLYGLVAMYKAHKSFFVSATYSPLCEDVLRYVFSMKKADMFKEKTKRNILTKDDRTYDADFTCVDD